MFVPTGSDVASSSVSPTLILRPEVASAKQVQLTTAHPLHPCNDNSCMVCSFVLADEPSAPPIPIVVSSLIEYNTGSPKGKEKAKVVSQPVTQNPVLPSISLPKVIFIFSHK